jgi:hypothetical protein
VLFVSKLVKLADYSWKIVRLAVPVRLASKFARQLKVSPNRNLPFAPELIVTSLSSQTPKQLLAEPRIAKPRGSIDGNGSDGLLCGRI